MMLEMRSKWISHEVTSGSDITPFIKIDKPLVAHIHVASNVIVMLCNDVHSMFEITFFLDVVIMYAMYMMTTSKKM